MSQTHLADKVNPYIGTISHTLRSTLPEVFLPYGVAKSRPLVSHCGDFYCNDHIDGFTLGRAAIRPIHGADQPLTLDHSLERCRCYGSRVELEQDGMIIESTVGHHLHAYRFTGADALRITLPEGGSFRLQDDLLLATIPIPEANTQAAQHLAIHVAGAAYTLTDATHCDLRISGAATCYAAISHISQEKAVITLRRDTQGQTFDSLRDTARAIWDALLSRVQIEGNTEDRQTVFYTALYRAFQRMTDYGEGGEYFSAYDGKVHAGGHFYTGDGLWDTFRCMHPLQLLLDTRRQVDILTSYIDMYKQSGLMPSFPGFGGDLPVMLGFHAAALFADAHAKGLDLDYATAYEGIRKNAMERTMLPWRIAPANDLDRCYYEKGYFPALEPDETETNETVHHFERRQAIAVTLEHCYDDWCVAQLAKALGHESDYALFMARSENYKNLYNEALGLMAPRTISGEWVRDFDPIWSGGQGGRDYAAENNTWTYTWSVMHAPEGLAALMGGKEAAAAKLDALFETGFPINYADKFVYLGQFPDATGLMGQFAMGNEPSFHIPYLYNYFGAPWKAQKRLRDLMNIWFTNSPTGICGDEDGGAMSSWLAFSALGFYPVCPGKAEYALGTPLFDRAAVQLENGRTFTIESQGAGDGLRYIQSATLRGEKLARPFLTHEDILAGGTLTLVMGTHPVKNW